MRLPHVTNRSPLWNRVEMKNAFTRKDSLHKKTTIMRIIFEELYIYIIIAIYLKQSTCFTEQNANLSQNSKFSLQKVGISRLSHSEFTKAKMSICDKICSFSGKSKEKDFFVTILPKKRGISR
jgi:hypothetical protein